MAKTKKGCKACRQHKLMEKLRDLVAKHGAYVVTLEEDEFEVVDIRIDENGMVRIRTGDYC